VDVIGTEATRVINLVHFPYTVLTGGLVLVQFNLNKWPPILTDGSKECSICNAWFGRCEG
jgi:hypothetical protein